MTSKTSNIQNHIIVVTINQAQTKEETFLKNNLEKSSKERKCNGECRQRKTQSLRSLHQNPITNNKERKI